MVEIPKILLEIRVCSTTTLYKRDEFCLHNAYSPYIFYQFVFRLKCSPFYWESGTENQLMLYNFLKQMLV